VTSNDVNNADDTMSFEMLSWATTVAPEEGTLIELDTYDFADIYLEADESITVRILEDAAAGFGWSYYP
jgi:hypothetical protein